MESNMSNLNCVNKIKKWNQDNEDFFNINDIKWLDNDTFVITIICGSDTNNSLKLYSNLELDYFFFEINENSSIEEKTIAELNYNIFNLESKNIDSVLHETYEKMNCDSDSENFSYEEEDDEFNIGVQETSNSVQKSKWKTKDLEIRNKENQVETFNIPKNLIYSGNIIFNIVSNEIIKLQTSHKLIEILVPDNNIYNILVRFKFKNNELGNQLQEIKKRYGYDYIELKLNINMYLYPFYPISLELIKPKINNSLVYSLMDIDFLKFENWNPTNSLEFVIDTLYGIFEKHAQVIVDSKFNSGEKSYEPLEYILMKLSSKYKINSQKHEDLQVDFVKISKNEKKEKGKDNKIWKSGVGYGHQGRDEWDINAYIKDQERINNELMLELEQIILYINEELQKENCDKNQLINIIEPSCLYTMILNRLRGTTLLELEKNQTLYDTLVDLSTILITNKLWDREDTLILINKAFTNISEEAKTYLEHFPDQKENNIFQKIVECGKMLESYEINIKCTDKKGNEEDIYVNELKTEVFTHMDIVNGDYVYKSNASQNSHSKEALMRIVREISSLPKSLPITFSSSVFLRADASNISAIKFLITGPKDTPYESGCFEFDAVFKSDYPQKPPQVLLKTTGNGDVRFNPNLYNCGKVCLSLLGTWSGQKGESWNEKSSTFLQVLISIQSLILVDEPYYNEPGWERQMHTEEGKRRSFDYNDNIRLQTLKWAIIDKIKNPSPGFENVIKKHFYHKREKVISTLDIWRKETKKTSLFNKFYEEAKELLNNLKLD
ncbi:Ubiquitin-conjugating enzyme [seawater metagenome]|uniref:Ubiquitin-conjugating enzyme n=1 Tax=seawater metagenome TaxID=1561972 RepID=A0A5E8CM93_9ZZZZ